MRRRGGAAWLGLVCWLGAAAAAADVEVYRPRHRLAEELEATAAGILADRGVAVVDPGTGALVLLAPREAIDETLGALRQLDRVPRSFRVESRVARTAELQELGVALEGWLEAGDLRVGRGPEGSGMRLVARAGGEESEGLVEQSIAVREGATAELWAGRVYPTAFRILREGGRERRVLAVPGRMAQRTGFRVRPRGLPDGSIELEVHPIAAQGGPGPGVTLTGAATRMRLPPGEWAALGSVARQSRSRGLDAYTGLGDAQRAAEHTLLVRVVPLDSAPE